MNYYVKTFILLSFLLLNACVSIDEKPQTNELPGVYHRVKPGESLDALALKYRVAVEEIKDINGIENGQALQSGQMLFFPDPDPIGKKIARLLPKASAVQPKKPVYEPVQKLFDFPVKNGRIIYHFSSAKSKPYDGIGIKAPLGASVFAAKEGRVLFVGDDGTKFGLLVIIQHEEPFITIYTHLARATVKLGQRLKRGELLGFVGTSGGIKIPMLHFQIRVNQRPKNPEHYLGPIKTYALSKAPSFQAF